MSLQGIKFCRNRFTSSHWLPVELFIFVSIKSDMYRRDTISIMVDSDPSKNRRYIERFTRDMFTRHFYSLSDIVWYSWHFRPHSSHFVTNTKALCRVTQREDALCLSYSWEIHVEKKQLWLQMWCEWRWNDIGWQDWHMWILWAENNTRRTSWEQLWEMEM